MDSDNFTREIAHELLPYLRIYTDGTVDRLCDPPRVPPSPSDPATGVSTKDVIISPETSVGARIYLPPAAAGRRRLPILVYFHGGGFCFGSAFAFNSHRSLNILSSRASVLVVSVDYRLAPENPLPAGYEDCWSALQWVASHSVGNGSDLWLNQHGDFNRVFVGGDSAGGNIVHNMAMRAGREDLPGGLTISGAILAHPYFWWSDLEPGHEERLGSRLWKLVHPTSAGGLDDPMINPIAIRAPSLAGLGCSRMMVCVAEKDALRDIGVSYYKGVKGSGWVGEVELFESEGEGHVFHIHNPESESSEKMIQKLTTFIQK